MHHGQTATEPGYYLVQFPGSSGLFFCPDGAGLTCSEMEEDPADPFVCEGQPPAVLSLFPASLGALGGLGMPASSRCWRPWKRPDTYPYRYETRPDRTLTRCAVFADWMANGKPIYDERGALVRDTVAR